MKHQLRGVVPQKSASLSRRQVGMHRCGEGLRFHKKMPYVWCLIPVGQVSDFKNWKRFVQHSEWWKLEWKWEKAVIDYVPYRAQSNIFKYHRNAKLLPGLPLALLLPLRPQHLALPKWLMESGLFLSFLDANSNPIVLVVSHLKWDHVKQILPMLAMKKLCPLRTYKLATLCTVLQNVPFCWYGFWCSPFRTILLRLSAKRF